MDSTKGFYTALGTPQNHEGQFLQESFARQVKDQIGFGAAGLLVMGSMGLGVFIRDRDYVQIARTAVQAAQGDCPVFVGVTDTSIGRSCDRIDALAGLAIDGVVATAPHYYGTTTNQQINFYSRLAQYSPYPVFLYDLPVAARSKITLKTMQGLAAEKNIHGIKTADMPLAEALQAMVAQGELPAYFKVFYSGLDTFDHASIKGIDRHLDGMFACTGALAQTQYQAFKAGDLVTASRTLCQIISLRDIFAMEEIMPSFTCAMNLLGYEGSFAPDYYRQSSPVQVERIKQFMKEHHLI